MDHDIPNGRSARSVLPWYYGAVTHTAVALGDHLPSGPRQLRLHPSRAEDREPFEHARPGVAPSLSGECPLVGIASRPTRLVASLQKFNSPMQTSRAAHTVASHKSRRLLSSRAPALYWTERLDCHQIETPCDLALCSSGCNTLPSISSA